MGATPVRIAPATFEGAGFADWRCHLLDDTRPAVGDVLAVNLGMTISSCLRLVGIGLVAMACAGSPKRPEASSPRVKDSASEKVASQRAAAPNSLQLERDDERWGFDAARERRREEQARKAQKQTASGNKAIDVTVPTAR